MYTHQNMTSEPQLRSCSMAALSLDVFTMYWYPREMTEFEVAVLDPLLLVCEILWKYHCF